MEFANRALEPFEFEEAKHIFTSKDRFDIRSLGREKTVLFINVSDTDRTFDQLVNIFYTQALQLLCTEADSSPGGKLNVPVRIIMDDFAASARIPDFDKIISVIRSRDISVSLILQSMTQLESMYSHAQALTITNNCDHLLYLGSQDLETANFIGTILKSDYRFFEITPEILIVQNIADKKSQRFCAKTVLAFGFKQISDKPAHDHFLVLHAQNLKNVVLIGIRTRISAAF